MNQNEIVKTFWIGTDNVSAAVKISSDYIDGKILDTKVEIHGTLCWVSGDDRMKFIADLQALIDKYKI
jgi:hypothetical protein